ncbi:hypothetical protein BaRGS_00014805, partial [Batillaria attramentaria]
MVSPLQQGRKQGTICVTGNKDRFPTTGYTTPPIQQWSSEQSEDQKDTRNTRAREKRGRDRLQQRTKKVMKNSQQTFNHTGDRTISFDRDGAKAWRPNAASAEATEANIKESGVVGKEIAHQARLMAVSSVRGDTPSVAVHAAGSRCSINFRSWQAAPDTQHILHSLRHTTPHYRHTRDKIWNCITLGDTDVLPDLNTLLALGPVHLQLQSRVIVKVDKRVEVPHTGKPIHRHTGDALCSIAGVKTPPCKRLRPHGHFMMLMK